MYRPNYFKLYELLPPELYKNEEQGWEIIDKKLLITLDFIRNLIKQPMVVNNWHNGGAWKYRGARTTNSADYRVGSYHSVRKDRKVMAADFSCALLSAEAIRTLIVQNADKLPYPIRLEKDVKWVHVDVAEKKGYKVYLFNA